jgi:CDGSH-type Zn-finger protein
MLVTCHLSEDRQSCEGTHQNTGKTSGPIYPPTGNLNDT